MATALDDMVSTCVVVCNEDVYVLKHIACGEFANILGSPAE
ncbi:hypothetical protein VRK_17330 [Vibrio sp. MEBiC08052]|nr:hypothetical protein VRK_17330 [Vibrio sp. MEBiC08052]